MAKTSGGHFWHDGKLYEVSGHIDSWAPDARAAFRALMGYRAQSTPQCDFDVVCPVPSAVKYCGGIPPHTVKPKPPYYVMYELLSRPTGLLKPGQLGLYSDNELYEYAGHLSDKKHWWVSYWWCGRGLRYAIERAKNDPEVYAIYIYSKPGRNKARKLIFGFGQLRVGFSRRDS